MGPIAEAGFTACAIDVRGYGGSDKPPAVDDYGMKSMVADVASIWEQARQVSPAVFQMDRDLVWSKYSADLHWLMAAVNLGRRL